MCSSGKQNLLKIAKTVDGREGERFVRSVKDLVAESSMPCKQHTLNLNLRVQKEDNKKILLQDQHPGQVSSLPGCYIPIDDHPNVGQDREYDDLFTRVAYYARMATGHRPHTEVSPSDFQYRDHSVENDYR